MEGGIRTALTEISDIYKKYYDRGLDPAQVSHVLLELSVGMMFGAKDFKETAEFSRFIIKTGDIASKSVARHWPPIDKKNWPFDPEQWPAD